MRGVDPNTVGKRKEHYPTDNTVEDMYKYYLKKKGSKKGTHKFDIDKDTYRRVLYAFNEEISRRMIEESEDIRLLSRLGWLGIRKNKRKIKMDKNGNPITQLPVDWARTKEMWKKNPEAKRKGKVVHIHNEHSDGYVAGVKYFKTRARYPNKSIYDFVPTRSNSRALAEVMKNPGKYPHIDYFERSSMDR